MPSTAISTTVNSTFTLENESGFGAVATEPGTGLSFSLPSLDLDTWDQVFAATYTLWVTTISDLAGTAVSGGSLSANTYYYKVVGVGANGPLPTDVLESAPSNEDSTTTSGGNLTVRLTWSALQGANYYRIYRGTVTNTQNILVSTTTALTFDDDGTYGSTAGSPTGTPAIYIEFEVRTFTNLVGEAVVSALGLGVVITASGTNGTLLFAPGTTNGLTWFFSGTTPGINLPIGGGTIVIMAQPTYTGQTIDATNKTFRFTNNGAANLTAQIIVIVQNT